MGVVGKAKNVHRESVVQLSWPGWKVILKLSMTLVSYSTWSVLSSPIGGVESPESGGDEVSCPLDGVGDVTTKGEGFLTTTIVKIREERNRTRTPIIPKMEIP
jgi:hypothetical protein